MVVADVADADASPATARVIGDLPFLAAAAYGEEPALLYSHAGAWQQRSFTQVAEDVRDLALGLADTGVAPGDRICVLSDTRPEWSHAALAILAAGAVVVPIYPTSSAEECAWVLRDSAATMVICENVEQMAKVESIRGLLPKACRVAVIDPAGTDEVTLGQLAGRGRLLREDRTLERRWDRIGIDDPAVIVYTSGTTGPPKGCVLTHGNWLTLCRMSVQVSYISAGDVVYLFLPLAHVFAQIVQFACLYTGATLAFFGGDPARVVAELAEVRPTFLPSVPRIFEKIYTLVTGGIERDRLAEAVRVGLAVHERQRACAEIPADLAAAHSEAETLFSRVRAVFGGRLRLALSGAAPISPQVLEFFHAAGVPVLEGYDMTETTGLGSVSTLDRFKVGSVGVAGPGLEIRIAPDGEVLMRGPHVFAGYWHDPAATAAVVDREGWLYTGDLGEIDEEGFLTITGRKKDVIITASGKNIAPAPLENLLRQSRWISHAVMFGDRKPYPVALITVDPEEIVPWAASRGLPTDLPSLVRDPRVRELVQEVVDAANERVSRAARIKRFTLLDHDLSGEAGELTPTLKVKRKIVHDRYADIYEALYG